jgi:hypothetical protein
MSQSSDSPLQEKNLSSKKSSDSDPLVHIVKFPFPIQMGPGEILRSGEFEFLGDTWF